MSENRYISVFIPVYNGMPLLPECIESVLTQKLPPGYELEFLITDSGSHDGSVEAIRSFGDKIIFNEIPNTEYGHGKTRQQAAEEAKGDYILFLSQDAIPFNDAWLSNMLEPFFMSPRIGCVYGRQIPRRQAPPTLKREVATVFNQLGQPGTIAVQKTGSFIESRIDSTTNNFFSDVNSAIRKDLIHKVPFRDVRYAEDQALAQDMQKAGYLKAYSPDGAVLHTNDYTVKEYYHRKFDEYLGLQKSIGYTDKPSIKRLFISWVKPTMRDWSFTLHDKDYVWLTKLAFCLSAPFYNLNRARGEYDALRFSSNQKQIEKHSLESRRKKV